VPFDRPVAPAFGHGAFHGAHILTPLPDEALQGGVDLGGRGAGHPPAEGRDLAEVQDRAEAQHQAAHRREPGTVPLQVVDDAAKSPVIVQAGATTESFGAAAITRKRCV